MPLSQVREAERQEFFVPCPLEMRTGNKREPDSVCCFGAESLARRQTARRPKRRFSAPEMQRSRRSSLLA